MKFVDDYHEKISVVVPVYNMEKFLERCIKSLINQSYKNIEIILVDDGSKDSSGMLCDKYALEDSRIVVIHKTNGGLSSARNAGIKKSTGEYITFIDSDDWIALDTYEYMMKIIKETKCDAIQCSFLQTLSVPNPKPVVEKLKIFYDKDILQYYLLSTTRTGSYSVCRFLYKKELINNICFRENKINEDIDFNYKTLRNAKKLVVSNQIKYFYYQSGNSLSTGGLKKKDFDLYEAANELLKLTEYENYKDIKFLGEVKYARTAFSLLSKIAYYGISDSDINKKDIVDVLTKEHRKKFLVLLKAPIGVQRKVLAVLFALNFKIGEFFVKIYKSIIDKETI